MASENAYRELHDVELKTLFEDSIYKPLVVLLTADWSGASHIMDTYMEDLSEQYYPALQFYFQDVEKNGRLSKELKVSALPYTFIIKKGKIIDSFTGILSRKKIERKLEDL